MDNQGPKEMGPLENYVDRLRYPEPPFLGENSRFRTPLPFVWVTFIDPDSLSLDLRTTLNPFGDLEGPESKEKVLLPSYYV